GCDRWVIGSDTVVIIDAEILGKPLDESDAIGMLRKLSGREHKVITGYSIINSSSGEEIKRAVETAVKFKKLTDDEIKGYVNSGEPMDKAGAYAIQGLGSFMVEGIIGSYSNVVGLPVCQIVNDLEEVGAIRLFK
ncbi:MAG: Maf family protein, partial [bacterium]|nr:Maf family protein [bacterium]